MAVHPNKEGVHRHRLHVLARAVAAIIGGYVVTGLAVACLARLLPMRAAEASIAATLASFAIYASIVVTAFSTRSMLRVWIGLSGALLLLGAGLYLSILMGGGL